MTNSNSLTPLNGKLHDWQEICTNMLLQEGCQSVGRALT